MNRAYLLAVLDRALKSAAQAAILAFGADQAFDAMHTDWSTAGGFALGGFVLSVLTSVASSGIGNPGPSLTTESVVE